MCSICGQPNFIRCNCVSAQPFCDQCNENGVCIDKLDSQCVIYHFAIPGYIPPPSRLINLGLPNGSSAETIFEKIDSLFGAGFFRPWITGNTATLDLELDGPNLPVVLKGNVNVSSISGNTLVINPDGLAVVPNYKVKVDPTSIPRYLVDTLIGGTDGCVSISVDDIGGLLHIQPLLDIQCFADRICSSSGSTRVDLGTCLIQSALTAEDSPSIDMDINSVGGGLQIIANSNISSASGNTIVINSDGLYAPGGGVLTGADNGLSLSGTKVELGGPLIKNTSIDFASSFKLTLLNRPIVGIGLASPLNNINFQVTANGAGITQAGYFENTGILSIGDFDALSGQLILTGGTQTDDANHFATSGQLNLNAAGDITLLTASAGLPGYASIGGILIKQNSGNIVNNIISCGFFGMYAADTGNVTDAAGVRISGVNTPPIGASYTGTITNYYGLKIEDIGSSNHASNITNKFAIHQDGTGDISRFFGPVQNAAGSTQFTSDSRVKENIKDFNRGLKEIEQINTHVFNYTYNKAKIVTGIIAQELESIIPEAVEKGNFSIPGGEKFTDFRMIDQNVLFYTMLNAIKELSAENKALNDRVFALESKNTVFGK